MKLSKGDNGELMMIHSREFKQNYSVPFVLTGYDFTRRTFINAKRTAFDFPAIFAKWIGMKDEKLKSDCNFFEEDVCYENIKVIGPDLQAIDVDSLPDEQK